MAKKTATFGLGCFWQPDNTFEYLEGVVETVVGYTGGTMPNPTFEDIKDHTESIQITFNSTIISYQQLLDHFWSEHDPTVQQKPRFRSVIFYHDDEQRTLAEESKVREEEKRGASVTTTIEFAGTLHKAEEEQRKFLQKMGRPNG